MTVRRCGIQLPSGKSCPTFLSTEQNVCRQHTLMTPNEARTRCGYPVRPALAPMLPPPRRRTLAGWLLSKL